MVCFFYSNNTLRVPQSLERNSLVFLNDKKKSKNRKTSKLNENLFWLLDRLMSSQKIKDCSLLEMWLNRSLHQKLSEMWYK